MAKMAIADQVLQHQDKDGMLRRALERIIQLYTDKSHFVYELLQNAEDAGASKIKFLQYPDKLVVLHDGHPFSMENLQGLCDIGKSDKINDLNQIGEFGVGFKSVFGICEKVQLFSHPTESDIKKGYFHFAVEILDFTHPVDIDDQDVDAGYTTKFIFPYSVGFTFSGFETVNKLNEVLSKRLQNLGITTLLFMKNLQSIDYEINLPNLKKSGSYLLDKTVINDHCSLVSAIGETDSKKDKEELVSYLVFSRPVKGIQAGRTIDIAFTVSVDDKGDYSFRASKYPYISVYFPTETESKLKFIVQGPYRTTPNRSSVPADDKDNVELAKQTALLLRDSVIELRNNGKLNFSLLKVLPIEEDVFYSAPLFECMFSATKKMMKEEKLLLCENGEYASARNVKIARGKELADILTDDLLTALLANNREYHWLPTFLTETNKTYKALYDFLTYELEIEVIRPENLRNAFNDNRKFLIERDDEWLIRLYNMYASVGAAFAKQRGGSSMLTAEFIKTSTGRFVAPYRKSDGNTNESYWYRGYENATYLPNIFLPTKNAGEMLDINFVDSYIYEQCKHFFTEILALQKPNEYEFFIRDFKKRYESKTAFTDDQHITDVKRLLKYRTNADYKDEVDGLIKKYLRLRCIKDGKRVYVSPFTEKVLFSVNSEGMSIEQYYSHIISYAYVDVDFYVIDDISREQLVIMGVAEDISVGRNRTNGEYYTGNPGRQPEWNTYNGFRWKLTLDKLDAVLEYIAKHPKAPDSMAKSSFIFRFLQNNESVLQGTVYVGGSHPNLNNAYSEIVATLRHDGPKYKYYGSQWDGKWLFTESCELVAQSEISKRELHPQLYGEVRSDSNLYGMLGFIKNEADQLEDAAKDYDRLTEDTKNKYFEIELQRRFGLSVADLEENFGGNTSGRSGGSGSYVPPQEEYDFPSSKVKNWDSLRKHAAEVLCFASPTKYEYKVRKIRVSKPVSEVRAYLMNMYKVDRAHKYACQMCHDVFPNVEMCQIANNPEVELDPMNLCLCPNCAAEYKKMRASAYDVERFFEDIEDLTETQISASDPVEVEFDNESIWFTQTHIAEIKELRALQEAADKFKDGAGGEQKKPVNSQPEEEDSEEVIITGTDIYRDYVGKKIKHKAGGTGIVRTCDGKYIGIEFSTGSKAGKTINYSLQMCLSNGLIELI